MVIFIIPVPKPRMTRSDVWRKRDCVMRYRAFCDELRLRAPKDRPEVLNIRFGIPMPQSWSKKKRAAMDGRPHQQKPDVDNCAKAFMDALYEDDCTVWKISAEKVWAKTGFIELIDAP